MRTPSDATAYTAAALALLGLSAWGAWTKQGEAEAGFSAAGTMGLKVEGSTKGVTIADDGTSITVAIKLADVTTGNSLRDRHMREDSGASQFPEVWLSVPRDQLKSADGVNEAEAQGTLTLHGKSGTLAFKYKATCAQGTCKVEGSAPLNVKDYDIKIRSYLGVTVKSEMKVWAKFTVAQ